MSDETACGKADNTEAIIEDLLDQWEDAREAGTPIDVNQLCQAHPTLRSEVQSRIARLIAIDGQIGQGLSASDLSAVQLPIASVIQELKFHEKGGLGAVYVGQDAVAHRPVAVKFLHDHLATDEVYAERFALEAEVTARLEHPGVIPLYGVGKSPEGAPFYAMRFIDGQSMDDLIQQMHQESVDGQTPNLQNDRRYRQLLNHFVSVCKTIAYAHNRGIVHRDIKPANVMLGRYGETIVVDWGLAVPVVRDEPFRQSGEKTLMPAQGSDSTSSGLGAGTPAYMSPEQASKLAPTPASDIYSLGATLFKILTGMPPVEGDSIVEIKQNVIDGRIKPLMEVQPSVAPAIAAIAQKALSLKPIDRYATALELAEDVESFLADEAVTAYKEPWPSKWSRLARRHRSATRTAITSVILGSVLAGLSLLMLGVYATRETVARRQAQAAQTRAEQLGRESLAASAQFLAKSMASEIDLRWRILEAEASSTLLRGAVHQLNDQVAELRSNASDQRAPFTPKELGSVQSDLQSWLSDRFIANHNAVRMESWFVGSADGTQLARVPKGASIGRNYQHRDYHHGMGHDLSADELAQMQQPPGPLANRIVHMSAVYESTNSQTLKV
ncbi:MAG: serine/threonine-protein kinase, partial [Planctomycetota bacterium]